MKDTEVVVATYVGDEMDDGKEVLERLLVGVKFPKGKRIAAVGDVLVKKLKGLASVGVFKVDAYDAKKDGEPAKQKLPVPRVRSRKQMMEEMKKRGRRAPTLARQPGSIDGNPDS